MLPPFRFQSKSEEPRERKVVYLCKHHETLILSSESLRLNLCFCLTMSRSSRITVLLVIDILFFLLELIVGAFLFFRYPSLSTLPFVRLCCGIASARCRQFPHAQVCVDPLILTFKPLMVHQTCSDVMSLVVALYAIKAHLSGFSF